MQKFSIKIDVEALEDIQKTTDWYNSVKNGLGAKFQKQVISQITKLNKNPYLFTIKYENVRCFLISKFPVSYKEIFNILSVSSLIRFNSFLACFK